ncbi:MAG: PaaX family transcriptional regulator [Carbonactinosporaceae bacterium]
MTVRSQAANGARSRTARGGPSGNVLGTRQRSARSLLLTVLGEYVRGHSVPVWTSALIDTLGLLGVEPKAARQALHRTAAGGLVRSDRDGRRACWSLTGSGRRLLDEGAERIYGFRGLQQSWDGRWVVVLASVPEADRRLRHGLRTRLSWAGFGSPLPGVWISPHAAREPEARAAFSDLGLDKAAVSFVARHGDIGEIRSLVAQAWDLASVEGRYERFIAEFDGLAPADPDEMLAAQTLLVHAWRRFPFLDPGLPPALLPDRWQGTTAAALFQRLHAEWHGTAEDRWREIAERP